MKILRVLILTNFALSGCSTFSSMDLTQNEAGSGKIQYESGMAQIINSPTEGAITPLLASANFQNHYKQQLTSNMMESGIGINRHGNQLVKNINHYVRGIMQDLVSNLQYVSSATPMAVTSFVFLDSDYSDSSLLGNQIAESFVHEVHKFGIPVIDFKTTDFVRVTPTGDYVLSRDYLELPGDLPIRYVLAGTLVKHQGGHLINARIIGMKSKAVVASAQGFLPADVSGAILNSDFNDGIKLTKG